jgi:hypothetical protein
MTVPPETSEETWTSRNESPHSNGAAPSAFSGEREAWLLQKAETGSYEPNEDTLSRFGEAE